MVLKTTDNDQSIHSYANSSAHTNITTIFALHPPGVPSTTLIKSYK